MVTDLEKHLNDWRTYCKDARAAALYHHPELAQVEVSPEEFIARGEAIIRDYCARGIRYSGYVDEDSGVTHWSQNSLAKQILTDCKPAPVQADHQNWGSW